MAQLFTETRYTEQFPFVGTPRHRFLIESECKAKRISRAEVVRRAVDMYFAGREDEFSEGSEDE